MDLLEGSEWPAASRLGSRPWAKRLPRALLTGPPWITDARPAGPRAWGAHGHTAGSDTVYTSHASTWLHRVYLNVQQQGRRDRTITVNEHIGKARCTANGLHQRQGRLATAASQVLTPRHPRSNAHAVAFHVLYDSADLRIHIKNGEAAWPRSRLRRWCFRESAAGTATGRWRRRVSTPPEVARTLRQLKLVQWLNPAAGLALIALSDWQSQQQRASQAAKGRVRRLLAARVSPVPAGALAAAIAVGVLASRQRKQAGQNTPAGLGDAEVKLGDAEVGDVEIDIVHVDLIDPSATRPPTPPPTPPTSGPGTPPRPAG